MMLTVLVPFSRPRFLQNVQDNFNRQTYQDKRLLVVENGQGIGCFKDLGCIVLSSEMHHTTAKNEGIAWMRKNRGGWFVAMDDDDYYGPEYLTEAAANLKNGDVLGKYDRFFKGEEKTYLVERTRTGPVEGLIGATIAARSEDVCEFQKEAGAMDDLIFTMDMRKRGAKIHMTSRYHFTHCRYKDVSTTSQFKLTTDEMAQSYLDIGDRVVEWDGFPVDIVNAKAPVTGYRKLEFNQFTSPNYFNRAVQEVRDA